MEDHTDNAGDNSRNKREAHWSEPCTNLMNDTTNNQQTLSEYILRAVARAYSYMGTFRETYATDTFHSSWETALVDYAQDHTIGFLKPIAIPTTMNFDAQLQDAYEMMQRLAVGIEQVTLDQALYRGSFLEQFRMIESHIVTILCQLHYAMVHQDLVPNVVVTKEIMGEEYRDMDAESARQSRDIIIMREYNLALEHLKDIFTEFEKVKA